MAADDASSTGAVDQSLTSDLVAAGNSQDLDSSADTTVNAPLPRRRRRGKWLIEWALILLTALVIALVFRAYVAQTFYIPSASMEPTLQIGDRIIVSKLSVTWGTIHRGDIVVFKAPENASNICGEPAEPVFVKRVIGLPGDHLKSIGNSIYVNGRKLNESWQHSPTIGDRPIPSGTVVPKDDYYMIGDNNSASCDSRYWGPINRSAIIGKAIFRIWPLGRFGTL